MSVINTIDDDFQQIYKRIVEKFTDSSSVALVLSLLLEEVSALVSLSDSNGEVIFASRAHTLLANGIGDGESFLSFNDLFSPDVSEDLIGLPSQAPLDTFTHKLNLLHKDGSLKAYQFKKIALYLQEETYTLFIANIESAQGSVGFDVDTYKTVANHLEFYDAVTGIANRNLFHDRLDKTLSLAKT